MLSRWLPILAVLWVCSVLSARADTITIVADPWCPYNCEPESDTPGFMVEIAERVFAEAGIEVRYETVPWVRALQATESGEYNGAIGASKVEATGFVFPAVEQGRMRNGFWVVRESRWQFNGVESLTDINLASLAGYSYGPQVEHYLEDPSNAHRVTELYGPTPLQNGLNMLQRGRIDALLEDEYVFRYEVKQRNEVDLFRLAGRVELDPQFSDVYIAFSPSLPSSQRYASLLGEGMARLRANGELDAILARYGVSDWRD